MVQFFPFFILRPAETSPKWERNDENGIFVI